MRHAILILAHHEPWLLDKILSYFNHEAFDVYLNIDPSMKVLDADYFAKKYPNIRHISCKRLHWGGFSLLKVELEMLECAMNEGRADYFHLISGQDYPIKPREYFINFFERENGRNFIFYQDNSDYDRYFERLNYYLPYDFMQGRNDKGRQFIERLKSWQRKLHIANSVGGFPKRMYVGSQWFSITREAVKMIVDYTHEHPRFYRRLKYTFAPEEVYIVTLLMNFFDHKKICSYNLRLIRWVEENGSFPAQLDSKHFRLVAGSTAMLARKLLKSVSEELIATIDRYLLDNNVYTKIEPMFRFERRIAEGVMKLISIWKVESVLLAGGNGLYIDALNELDITVNGISSRPLAMEAIRLLGMEEFYQEADITQQLEMEEEDRFDMLLMVDQMDSIPQEKLPSLIGNFEKVANRYVLVVEHTPCPALEEAFAKERQKTPFMLRTDVSQLALFAFNTDAISVYLFIKE